MREAEFKAKEKKVQKMTRDGLAEKNLAQSTQENISNRIADVSFAREKADGTAAGHRAAARERVSDAKPGKKAKTGIAAWKSAGRSRQRSVRRIL